MNQGRKFVLAVVLGDGDDVDGPYSVRQPFAQEPQPGVVSMNYEITKLLTQATQHATRQAHAAALV